MEMYANLSAVGEESEDEGREEEIKQLLSDELYNETFESEDENHSLFSNPQDKDNSLIRNDSLINNHKSNEKNLVNDSTHENHCPLLPPDGDSNGNFQFSNTQLINCKNTSKNNENENNDLANRVEFYERQFRRAGEEIESLKKDKRAQNHQIGLMRTEMIQMKSSYDDVVKIGKLKDEEIDFLKSKVDEVLNSYDRLKKSEEETRDENNRLILQMSKLEQEKKMLSAIGSSLHSSEFNSAITQIREKHAADINLWKNKVEDLESQLRIYQVPQISKKVIEVEKVDNFSQSERVELVEVCTETEIDDFLHKSQVDLVIAHMKGRHMEEMEFWKVEMGKLEAQLAKLTESYSELLSSKNSKKFEDSFTQTSKNSSTSSTSVQNFTQTDETLETYKILASLIEQWVREVEESSSRASVAEKEKKELEKGLKLMKKKFESLNRVVVMCRQEWRSREDFLVQKLEESREKYVQKLEGFSEKILKIEEEILGGSNSS